MKTHTGLYKWLLGAILLTGLTTQVLAADDPGIEKKKTWSKSFTVGANDKFSVTNQFGEVKINTWAKNEIKVDVNITIKANSEEKAQAVIDNITIEDSKSADGIAVKTVFGKTNWNGSKGDKNGNQSMEVNYEINMPAGTPLTLVNQFGKTFVPDLKGAVDITQKFGDLTAGNLPNAKEIKVEFGSAVVESIGNCKFTIKYSKGEVKKMSGAIKANVEFCDKLKMALDNSVTDFNLNNSYSKIEIAVAPGFGGDFDIHTNFGDFKNSSSIALQEQKEDEDHGPKFDKDFSGKSGNGACKVKIKSSFGTVKFI